MEMPNHVLEEVDLVVDQALSFQALKSKLSEVGFDVENITNSDVVSLISEMVFNGTSHRLGEVVAEAVAFRDQMRERYLYIQKQADEVLNDLQATSGDARTSIAEYVETAKSVSTESEVLKTVASVSERTNLNTSEVARLHNDIGSLQATVAMHHMDIQKIPGLETDVIVAKNNAASQSINGYMVMDAWLQTFGITTGYDPGVDATAQNVKNVWLGSGDGRLNALRALALLLIRIERQENLQARL
jgi:hypothetical protein